MQAWGGGTTQSKGYFCKYHGPLAIFFQAVTPKLFGSLPVECDQHFAQAYSNSK